MAITRVSTDGGLSFEIRGYDRVRNNLRAVAVAHPKETDSVMRAWSKSAADSLSRTPYPAKPANSRYKRTFALKAGWNSQQVKPGAWAITNRASAKGQFYARYVVGPKSGPQGQAWMHRGRWWTADEVLSKTYIPKLTVDLSDRYVDLWNE